MTLTGRSITLKCLILPIPDVWAGQQTPQNLLMVYEAKLQKWIDLDYNYFTNTVEGKGSPDDILSIQESLDILQQ
ncbi:hypothetical protein [Pectobacterium versatile]|uniref:Uncharacterized protein n=1 Tax=Pectobacterium versatile TaxID=2488639 RepID=A0A855M7I1_9GAMM|nr:hypothetical protein [Pectobacterium versatile]MBK4824827.1 hypothetical protein [Pectobacterium carotovorum subsp. carotovorum]POY48032.1 hypothetical protein F131LOC_04211 [Pectobacterium versatile]POY53503.1 hypothetical protein F018LOC_03168 [Pectobacterium versatile]PVY71898.1 hypothetical protein C7330_0927 [Pectobacterium versatile]RUR95173.1 hypothetical protein PB16LOC_00051 [Pectobacterium versatile]